MASSPDNSKEILTCCACSGDYDETSHKPMVLGNCGHSICGSCLRTLQLNDLISCPNCRECTRSRDVKVNYNLRDAAIQKQAKACDEKGEEKPRPPTPPRQYNFHQRNESESEVNPLLVGGAAIAGAAVFALTSFLMSRNSNKRN